MTKINLYILIALVIVFLVSCEPNKKIGKPLDVDFNPPRSVVEVTVKYYKSELQVTNAYAKYHNVPRNSIETRSGWAVWSPSDNECTIHVVEPAGQTDSYAFETWGHELVHCTHGSWHKE